MTLTHPPPVPICTMLAFVGELLPRLPAVLTCWLYAGAIGAAAAYGEGAPVPVRIVVALLALAAGAFTLWRAVRAALLEAQRHTLAPSRFDPHVCPGCGYPLLRTGNTRPWCPECGPARALKNYPR